MKKLAHIMAFLIAIATATPVFSGNGYKNFEVAVYARAYEVQKWTACNGSNQYGTKFPNK